MENNELISQNTKAWRFQTVASFVISLTLTVGGIASLPADMWIRGFLMMGLFFTLASAFTLAKTMRDDHEAGKIANRIKSAKTEKILKEYEN